MKPWIQNKEEAASSPKVTKDNSKMTALWRSWRRPVWTGMVQKSPELCLKDEVDELPSVSEESERFIPVGQSLGSVGSKDIE